jgi:hypothetical protein
MGTVEDRLHPGHWASRWQSGQSDRWCETRNSGGCIGVQSRTKRERVQASPRPHDVDHRQATQDAAAQEEHHTDPAKADGNHGADGR